EIDEIIREKKKNNKSKCAFCSRLRRGHLYTFASENKFTKIALGHHREDANETLLMNMFFSGRLKGMAPLLHSDNGCNVVIRPLIYTAEADIACYAQYMKVPIIHESCIPEAESHRALVKKLICELEETHQDISNNMISAQKRITPSHLLDPAYFSD
ncbi:MAG: tRNA 2-thiocytidine(32) synthetase TtcA, partial [Candidatus Cloacimonetes bacterium]|nr:tRNA 2-thiocytidine(32) synthetase TtcA [Candidatus Cloacimonadota bacterium]